MALGHTARRSILIKTVAFFVFRCGVQKKLLGERIVLRSALITAACYCAMLVTHELLMRRDDGAAGADDPPPPPPPKRLPSRAHAACSS